MAVTNENGTESDFGVTFGGAAMNQAALSTSNAEFSHIYYLDGAAGTADIEVSLGTSPIANGARIYAVSLSGARTGVGPTASVAPVDHAGDLTAALNDVALGSYVISAFSDNENNGNFPVTPDVIVTGDLAEVLDAGTGIFNGPFGNNTGSMTGTVASGFASATDVSVTFSDIHESLALAGNPFFARSNIAMAAFAPVPAPPLHPLGMLCALTFVAAFRRVARAR